MNKIQNYRESEHFVRCCENCHFILAAFGLRWKHKGVCELFGEIEKNHICDEYEESSEEELPG